MIQSKSGASGSIFNQQLYLAVVSLNKLVSLTDFAKHTFAFLMIPCEFLSRFCEHEGKKFRYDFEQKRSQCDGKYLRYIGTDTYFCVMFIKMSCL